MAISNPIESYETVQIWSKGLTEQWGGDPLTEDTGKLEALSAFCDYMDKNPDELYAFCFLRKRDTGERFASKKRREELTQKVFEFINQAGLSGVEKRRLRSSVYSFFTHNGVLV